MIPILYEATETAFVSNGLGRLSDCISCIVTEERNGRFDLELQYPVTGIHFSEITEGRIIGCTHDEGGDRQPFIIYSSSKPLDGIVTFNAYHLSYKLNDYIVKPFWLQGNYNAQIFLTQGANHTVPALPFTVQSDITATRTNPRMAQYNQFRAFLGGIEGSVLDLYGGEYEFDVWTVNLWSARGSNNGVTVRYGKNLADFTAETDFSGAYTHVVGTYNGDALNLLNQAVGAIADSGHTLPGGVVAYRIVDFTNEIENGETKTVPEIEAELATLAANYATANKVWEPAVSIEVDFVQLWQTEEYQNLAPLLKCKLCDTITVTFGKYGISDLAVKIVSVEWDALAERYQKMTLGGLATTLSQSINSGVSGSIQANADAIQSLNSRGGVSDVKQNGTSVVSGGVASVTVPTKTSDLLNDSGFITAPTSVQTATVSSPYTGSLSYIKLGRMVIFGGTIGTTGALSNGGTLATGLPANNSGSSMFYALNNNSTSENVPVYVTNTGNLLVRGSFSSSSRSLRVSGAYISTT